MEQEPNQLGSSIKETTSNGWEVAVVTGCVVLVVLSAALLPWGGAGRAQVRNIAVEGTYSPATVEIVVGRPADLRFWRPSDSACTRRLVVDGLHISTKLKPFAITDVRFTPRRAGHFAMHCGMEHLKGQVVVEDPLNPSAFWPVYF